MLHKSAKSRGCLPQSVRHVEDFIGAGSYDAAIFTAKCGGASKSEKGRLSNPATVHKLQMIIFVHFYNK
ncbi:hypothetical protein WKH08_03825 [Pantoea agglomerans]|uniref:hypothetical protein n=1 Tax=Enterobacter agglomerans TaxID=549 RepID=UPI002785A4D6|nr:hypothetical protein [Pantoea agglomerans]MDQ0631124.1 hypothetical protein [Pantoea agglomerans]